MARIGDPLGYAAFGQVVTDDDGLLICGECGRPCRQLATHVRYSHGLSAAEYRERYGLGRSTRLVSRDQIDSARERANQRIEQITATFDRTRDPDKAREASRGLPWTPQTRARRQALARARRTPDLTPEQVERLGDGLDLQEWADAARRLITEDGVSLAALGRAADITPATVTQRLRRYPPRE